MKKLELRRALWFEPDDLRSFGHCSRIVQMGYAKEDWDGKPIIAILNSWSDINPCHAHFKDRVEQVKRGVLQAGGFPIEWPTLSLAEQFVKLTTMLYRNMLAMEVEALLRSHPVDDVELARRRTQWIKSEPHFQRGYGWMFARHISEANEGCDFDYLESGLAPTRVNPQFCKRN
jgi:dihydroxyacid dehydratase/phosphogluconate dehydratase